MVILYSFIYIYIYRERERGGLIINRSENWYQLAEDMPNMFNISDLKICYFESNVLIISIKLRPEHEYVKFTVMVPIYDIKWLAP